MAADRLRRADWDILVDTLDLWDEPLPDFDRDKVAAKMTCFGVGELDGATRTAWDEVTRIMQRFIDADHYAMGVPMSNGGIPYRLKQYIDIITQPGLLFGFDPVAGYHALLQNKKATVVYTSGVYPTQMYGSATQPGDADRVGEYGEIGEIPSAMFQQFMTLLSGPNAPNPQDSANAIADLIRTPKGRRPARTVVGTTYGADALNDATAPDQANVVEALGLGHLATVKAA